MPQQDLGLRSNARAHLEQAAPPPEREAVVHHGLEKPGLAVQPIALGRAVAVEVSDVAGSVGHHSS